MSACSGRFCLTDAQVVAWVRRAWSRAVREGWAWDGYYFFLVGRALDYMLHNQHGHPASPQGDREGA